MITNIEETKKQKILVVDDSGRNRSILAGMLRDEYEIIEAVNGMEGVAALQKHEDEICLVLLDIEMPEMDGFEVLTAMDKRGWLENIPVIMIADEPSSDHVNRAYDLGVTDYIHRPFNARVVRRRVRNTIMLYAKQKVNRFFASMSQEIQFEYNALTNTLTFSKWGADFLKVNELVMDPTEDEKLLQIIGRREIKEIWQNICHTTYEEPVFADTYLLRFGKEERWYKIVVRSTWMEEDHGKIIGAIGKFTDIHEEYERIYRLEKKAASDSLTGLYNHMGAKRQIEKRISYSIGYGKKFGLILFDLDYFKNANDKYGHLFGDNVLKYVADKLKKSIRREDIAARVGGDEFLVFMEFQEDFEPQVKRIFQILSDQYEKFQISVSMGAAVWTESSKTYEEVFHSADQALYASKRSGRNQYQFYKESMKDMLSVLSPIDEWRSL